MAMDEQAVRRIASLIIVVIMGILAFIVVKPILLAILGGLLLAYIFYPLFIRIQHSTKSRTLAASIVLIITILIVLLPLIVIAPTLRTEIAHLFIFFQSFDVSPIIQKIFASSSDQVIVQIAGKIQALITREIGTIIDSIPGYVITFSLDSIVILFVFFFALKEYDQLSSFAKSISGLNKSNEKLIVNKFKDITSSILYGHVVVGFFQGLLAGLGLVVFGIPNAFALTIVAIFLAIIPFIGTPLIWIPATIYLFSGGHPTAASIYLIYNLLIVSTLDNVIKAYIISKRSNVSQAIILIGMVGGLIIFGIIGLVLGPLIIAYFITFLDLHRNKKSGGHVFSS